MNYKQSHAQVELGKMFGCPSPSDPLPAPVTATINGVVFDLAYYRANRKCFDFLPTPTYVLKANGKRISYKAAFALLADS